MADGSNRLRLEEIDWPAVLPVMKIFGSFRMAIHPTKLGLALAMIVLLYLWGSLLDGLFFRSEVYPGERAFHERLMLEPTGDPEVSMAEWREGVRAKHIQVIESVLRGKYSEAAPNGAFRMELEQAKIEKVTGSLEPYTRALGAVNQAFQDAVEEDADDLEEQYEDRLFFVQKIKELKPRGIFVAAMEHKLAGLNQLVQAAVNLDFGVGELLPGTLGYTVAGGETGRTSVVGALKQLIIVLPGWLYAHYFGFLLIYGIGAFLLWALFGGAIARLAAVHATRDERVTAVDAVGYGAKRWLWFIMAPLIPLIFALLIGLIMAIGGLVFFNLEVLEWVGGLLFFLALGAGLVITVLLIGLVGGYNLLYPSVAIEGTDAFDAISRAYNYVLGRPWRTVFYNAVALVYGAITYIFLTVVVYVTLVVTHQTAGVFVWRAKYGVNRFEAMLPEPSIGSLLGSVDWYGLNWSAKIAGTFVCLWAWLLVALLVAFAISYYFSASTWIYLLLRRVADGTEYDDIHLPADEQEAGEENSVQADVGRAVAVEATSTQSTGPAQAGSDMEAEGDQPPASDKEEDEKRDSDGGAP